MCKERNDFFAVWTGLTFIGNALKDHTEKTSNDLRERINQELGPFPDCTAKCSKKDNNPKR